MNIDLVEEAVNEIAEYNPIEAGLSALRARMANVEYDVVTVKGMAVAKADRAEVRTLRVSLEAKRKEIKAPALAHAKRIDDEAKRITAALLEIEEPIDAQIKARELVLEQERAARELAERERITAIHQRIADIREFVAMAAGCRTAHQVDNLLSTLSLTSLTGFEEFSDEAAAAHLDAITRVNAILSEKREAEAEAARVQAEQAAAAEQLAKDRAELAAARAEQKRIDDEAAARREAEQAVIDARNAAAAEELREAREALAAQAKQMAQAQAVIDEAARKVKEAEDLAAYQAAVVQVEHEPAETPEALPGGQHYSTTTFKDNGEPILLNKDGTRSIFCDIADDYDDTAPTPTSADIYAMCAESDTADKFAVWLCASAGVAYPPVNE